ncbi:hypothetical protein [Rhodococcus sp. Q1]|uniref:hypothetical protein n=1 Tax=Rhodococcus sp. Q1 TaxID=2508718 RepID=UPI001A91D119|nr:hypothetical protein [Rhodococcus sp. Q1]
MPDGAGHRHIDNQLVNPRFSEPEYQLVWPRDLFKAEAAKLLNMRDVQGWDDDCALLLEDAFIRGYRSGPLSEFHDVPAVVDPGRWGTEEVARATSRLTPRQEYLRLLMAGAEQLREDPPPQRRYWSARKAGQTLSATALEMPTLVREFVSLIGELDNAGYLENRFGKDCVDDPRDDTIHTLIYRELGSEGIWPLDTDRLTDNIDLFYDIVELLHDQVARPNTRFDHDYGECGWHHGKFDIRVGRIVYRWRVNKLFNNSALGLRLAENGDDVGRLVTVTDEARTALAQSVAARSEGEPADQVRHALALFRERGSDRHQKRSAVAALALVLEERRHGVLTDALAKSDRGALFDLANNFHVRHQDAKQKRDYDDFYLDWIFWVYLSTIELTNQVLDTQRTG